MEKDVLLYKYENTKFFRYLNLFGVSQFVFWTYLSNFATTLRDVPAPKNTADQQWYEKLTFLGENKYKNGMAALFFLVGKIEILFDCPGSSLKSFLSRCWNGQPWCGFLQEMRALPSPPQGR